MNELFSALREVLESEQEERKAREEYVNSGGYSWEWAGFGYIKRKEKARAEFSEELNRVIDQRIAKKLKGVTHD